MRIGDHAHLGLFEQFGYFLEIGGGLHGHGARMVGQ